VHEREKSLREALARQTHKRATTLDALDFALSIHDVDLAEYSPSFAWEQQPVTQKQADTLAKFGVDLETVKGKGHASALLDRLLTRRRQGLATPKQIRFLRRYHYPKPEEATFEQASAFLDRVFNNPKPQEARR
jgi:hypothetical protein